MGSLKTIDEDDLLAMTKINCAKSQNAKPASRHRIVIIPPVGPGLNKKTARAG